MPQAPYVKIYWSVHTGAEMYRDEKKRRRTQTQSKQQRKWLNNNLWWFSLRKADCKGTVGGLWLTVWNALARSPMYLSRVKDKVWERFELSKTRSSKWPGHKETALKTSRKQVWSFTPGSPFAATLWVSCSYRQTQIITLLRINI